MSGETSRTKAGDALANLIYPGGNGDSVANVVRDAGKIVVLTAAAYAALTPDANTIYIVVG